MYDEIEINLRNLLLSLSDGMDLASHLIAAHGIRTAFITWEVARHANLAPSAVEASFAAALLHDLGALSVEEKAHLHAEEALAPEGHCIKGASLLDLVPFLKHLAPIVRYHHHRYDAPPEMDQPKDLQLASLVCLADTVERAIDRDSYILHQSDTLRRMVQRRAGTSLDPDAARVFLEVSEREDFWLDLESPRLYALLLHRGPHVNKQVGIKELEPVSEMFRSIIDF